MTVSAYLQPGSAGEALELLAMHGPDLLVIAGGTVAMPLINEGISLPGKVMGLRRAGLSGFDAAGDGWRIGATTTLTALARQDHLPILRDAAGRTAAWAVRNMATVGGNLFTPPPGGDITTALLALDAVIVVASRDHERRVALADFLTGFLTNDLATDELVMAIEVPAGAGATAFVKFGRKEANTPAVVSVAARVVRAPDGRVTDARIALGAAGPHPFRARAAEAALRGRPLDRAAIAEAAAAAGAESDPATDGVASAWYRRRMVGVFVRRTLAQIAAPAAGEGN